MQKKDYTVIWNGRDCSGTRVGSASEELAPLSKDSQAQILAGHEDPIDRY